ncbi:MAG TPA: DUF4349 domain-containing protein [Acidimicrobiales bacterium]|nr:DUF4349 domain-containing protein [Acidimicrobiales bacterium]
MIDERFLQQLVDDAMAGVDPPADGPDRIRAAGRVGAGRAGAGRAGAGGVEPGGAEPGGAEPGRAAAGRAGVARAEAGRVRAWVRARLTTKVRIGLGMATVVIVVAVSVALFGSGGRSPARLTAGRASSASGGTGASVATGSGTDQQTGSSSGQASRAITRPASGPDVAASGSGASAGSGSSGASGLTGAAASGVPPASGSVVPNQVPSMATRVIKTGSISLQAQSGHLQDLLSRASAEADGLGGYVQASNAQTPAGTEVPSGSVTLEVPVAQFQNLVNYVQRLGKNLSVTTAGRDVTADYVDLQARLTALQGTRTQFEQILTQATAIPDILSVESQISDVETQIEQIQGQIQVMDQQTSYSTLTVQVSEAVAPGKVVTPPKPPSGLEKSWQHARHSFAHGVEAVIGALGGIAVFLIFAGALLLLARFGWGLVRRRLV